MDDSSTNKYQVFRNCRPTPPFPQGKKPSGSMQIVFREGLKQKIWSSVGSWYEQSFGGKNLSQPPQNIRPTTVTIFLRSISGSQIPSGSSFERRPLFVGDGDLVWPWDASQLFESATGIKRNASLDFMRILQGSKIATQAAQLPLETAESERHCSPQQIAGINDLPVVLSAAETLRICGKGNTGKTGGPKKATFAHFMYWIHFINVMNLCVCVPSLYHSINVISSILHDLLIKHPIICLESWKSHEISRKISHPGQQFGVPYPVGIQVKGYFNLWYLRGWNDGWPHYHWWLTTLQVRESRFLGYHPKKNGTHILSLQMPAYKVMRNPNLPQSLPILFHSFCPLESFTSSPPHHHSSLPKPPFDMFRIPQPHEELVGYHPSWRSPASDYPCREDPHPRYVWKWCSKFPFPVWWDMASFPWRGILFTHKSWSFSCCAAFLQWKSWKSPPLQSAWSCCVHPRRPRCEAVYETIQPNSCTPWLTVRSWKLMLGRLFTFWERKLFPMLCWVQGCCFSVSGV